VPKSNESSAEKEQLMSVMTHLRDVKVIKDKTLDQVDPMKQAIMLMKKHQVKMDEDFLVTLETSKSQLKEVSEKALGPVKESILPLQNQEAQNIKGRLARFGVVVQEFRIKFENHVPKHITETTPEIIASAYDQITEFYTETCQLEEEAKELNNLEGLFDLQRSSYKQLKDCKSELVSLKEMWDLIALIDNQFDSWKQTLWDQINTENLTQLIKDMQSKQCNPTAPQNKVISKWRGFVALNERVKNMNTILPLISQLHSEFMQGRHWKKLMNITEQHIEHTSPKFCMNDLIKLHLYKYAEEVTEIVDGAQKESKIEGKVSVISRTWDDLAFTFVEKGDTYELGALDVIIEFVETQSMDLMTMLAQKEVEEFKENVSKWQKTLKTVDAVIEIWMKVQKNWSRLNPIFLASEDIRGQLPDDTKRFEKVDIDWKELMRDAVENSQVVEACTCEGREEQLNGFYQDIETCEKALNAYLEEKKKVFPRFYFISNQSLLDILSNGNNPVKVDEQIGNCFDGLRNLKFLREGPEPHKTALGMFSKDGDEFIEFLTPFVCNGAVENYLCDLEAKMQ
jgi:dynein heavy chain, axonemal